MNSQKHSGYTLIELMVATALGVLLLGIVVAIYLGSKTTFRAAEGLARSQESTRFAMHFLKRDIRTAGYHGCSNGVSLRNFIDDGDTNDVFSRSEDSGVFGWEFTGTEQGADYNLDYDEIDSPFTQADLIAVRDGNSGAATNWVGQYLPINGGAETPINLPAAVVAARPLIGSDIISVTSSEVVPNRKIQQPANIKNPVLEVINENEVPSGSGLELGTIIKIGDCSAIDTFQNAAAEGDQAVSAGAGAGAPGNTLNGAFKWQKSWDFDATLYRSVSKIYFVGTGAGGKPSLYVYESDCGIGGACGTVSELIEGVENMQVLYGEDTSDDDNDGTNLDQDERDEFDGLADLYLTANNVSDFRSVIDVKVGLLVRSPDAALDTATNPSYFLLNSIEITPPDDRRQRFVTNATVRLQNRGL